MKIVVKTLIALGCILSVAQADDKLTNETHQKFIDDYILAHLQDFKSKAHVLNQAAGQACQQNNDASWYLVKQDFAVAVEAWMPLQSMRFDAFEKNSRDLRIYFWPNSRGEKQAGKFLPAKDPSKLVPSYFPNLSVALQGLPIVEWLLYHKDSSLSSKDASLSAYSCDFLMAVSLNIVTVTDELIGEFGQDGAAREALLTPSETNDLYSALPEVTLQFYKVIHAMVEVVHGQKLSRPIGTEFKNLRPKRLEMWRAGVTKANMLGNIKSIFNAYKIFSPMVLLSENGAAVDAEIIGHFEATLVEMDGLPIDFYQQLNGQNSEKTWKQARGLIAALAQLKNALGLRGTEALGIPLGFNALDGD